MFWSDLMEMEETEDDECESDWVTISDEDMISAGFYPMCQEYEEKEWGGE